MSVLVDTNVLLRRMQPSHDSHSAAVDSVERLLRSGEPVHFTVQNIAEFWNVLTRPAGNNGLGFPVSVAAVEIRRIERVLALLPDAPGIYREWKALILRHSVIGSKVHDAWLAAAMRFHGVPRILTFNAGDFARYGVEVLDPAEVSAG